jgi:4-amino-4-deoxy-L-arabinose transferase-like glycosyltransferase
MPYHFIDMHFRVTVAENLSFVFLPFILLAIKKIIENYSKKWLIALSLGFGLLILSHQAISVMFLPVMIAYSLFIWIRKTKKRIKNLIF